MYGVEHWARVLLGKTQILGISASYGVSPDSHVDKFGWKQP